MAALRERIDEGPLAGTSRWTLEIVAATRVTPSMVQLRLANPELDELGHQPGQDLMVAVPVDGDATLHRRYTIRRLDPAARILDLEVVAHGDGPGARWASSARPGDLVTAIGPRGKITLADTASWHLFFGDESAIPATLAMLEALPAGTRGTAFLEVGDPGDQQPCHGPGDLTVSWLPRADDVGTALADAARTTELPPGLGHAYLAGEFGAVQAIRAVLLERGLALEQLAVKPYWRRGRENLVVGEPPRD
jgi:NADPH-dependent ferric siderophore reductase